MFDHRQDKTFKSCNGLEKWCELLGIGWAKLQLTLSTLPMNIALKDHRSSKSSSGLGLRSSPRAIETAEVTPFPSSCTTVNYVTLGRRINKRILAIFFTQRS